MKKLKGLYKFKYQVMLAFTALLIFTLSVVIANIYQVKNIEYHTDRVQELRQPTTENSQQMEMALYKSLASLRGWLLLNDYKFKEENIESWAIIEKSLKSMERLSLRWTNSENNKRLDEIRPLISIFQKLQQQILNISIANKPVAINILDKRVVPTAEKIFIELQLMVEDQKLLNLLDINEASSLIENLILMTKIFATIMFLVFVSFGIFIIKSVTRPITNSVNFANDIANLKFDTKFTPEGAIEFKELGDSLISMRTNLYNHQNELQVANEELTQFAYRTSHDLKGPLTTTRRLADFIIKDLDSDNLEEAKNNLRMISEQMKRLETLVSDILSLSKAGKNSITKSNIDFHSIIDDTKENLRWLLEESHCQIISEISLNQEVRGERVRYQQIIENLISNGVKYRNREKSNCFVRVGLRAINHKLIVEVEDNGVGIPENHKKDLYKMFKRFHPRLSSGSGLGMAIVKKHIDSLNGQIICNSSHQGTKFKMEFPINNQE